MLDEAPESAPHALNAVEWAEYDFIDLGCSSGRSVGYGMKRFGGRRGIGVDLDERKLSQARDAGIEVVRGDATQLKLDKCVRFVSMLDFLEHLPDLATVEAVIASAAQSATDFLFIKHPSFEGLEQVETQGVRQYWWDWHGHTAPIRVADYCQMFDRLGLRRYMIRYLGRIDDSQHESIIPTTMPRDQSADVAAHVRDKPFVRFSPPVWRRQDIFVALRPFSDEEWHHLTEPTPADLKMIASDPTTVAATESPAFSAP